MEGALRNGHVADFQAARGEDIEWVLADCARGNHHIDFEYYAGGCDRPLRLLVDGVEVVSSLSFPKTGSSWSSGSGRTESIYVQLAGGPAELTRIRLESIGYSGNNLLNMGIRFDSFLDATNSKPTQKVESLSADGADVGCPFYVKAPGGQSCAAGMITDTEDDCRAAGAEVGITFLKIGKYTPIGRPAGCFWDTNGYTYLNPALETTHVWDGSGGICRHVPEVS